MRKIFNNNLFYFTFFLIILLGFLLRLHFILIRNVFIDETFYIKIALENSFADILLINHWIKDHGILYYLFLKPFLFFTTNIIYLRLVNLLLYLVSSLAIFTIFNLLGSGYWAILPVFLYSINRYFVYLHSMVSPFNLVSFFAFISMLSLSYYIFNERGRLTNKIAYGLFIISTILGFYSDYSFFYMFFFYFFILFFIIWKRKNLIMNVSISYLLITDSILPGIYQFFRNFNQIAYLFNNTYKYEGLNFLFFIKELSRILVFRPNQSISLLFIGALIFLVFLIKKNAKREPLNQLNIIIIISFLANVCLIFLFTNQFFSILTERSFWFFYFSLIMIVSSIFILYIKHFKIVSLLILMVFMVFCLGNYLKPGNVDGEVSYEIKYNNLINNLIKENGTIKNIVLVDKRYDFWPITNYFFSNIYPSSGKYFKEINSLKSNLKSLERIKSISEINKKYVANTKNSVFVLFSPTKTDLDYAIDLQNQNKNLIIYYSKAINNNQQDFFRL